MRLFVKTVLTVLVSTVFMSVCQISSADDDCERLFNETRRSFSSQDFSMYVVLGNAKGMNSYSLSHRYLNGRSYTRWLNLNGEVSGYDLRDLDGYDFNRDKNYKGPLTWHQSVIIDKLFSRRTKLSDYNCVLTGRTRLSGYKTSILRLAPTDDLRYAYVIAVNDENSLPVEVDVMSPDGAISLRAIMASHRLSVPEDLKTITTDSFSQFSAPKSTEQSKTLVPWSELNIPPSYKLIEENYEFSESGQKTYFQLYSDGLTDFRVYRSSSTSIMIPYVQSGTISVLRCAYRGQEYAVVGELPLALAESVLAKMLGQK